MLTLRPTKMLAKRLKLAVPAVPPPVDNRVADWCVHEFRDGRQRHLMFCNTASLFPIVLPGRGVTDANALIRRFLEGAWLAFEGTELELHRQRWIEPEAGAVQWAPIPDKVVLSSVNELIFMARHGMDKSPAELAWWLAQTPMKALGYNSPDRVFPTLRGPERCG